MARGVDIVRASKLNAAVMEYVHSIVSVGVRAMERITAGDISEATAFNANDPRIYSDHLLETSDSPLILGSKAIAACSAEHVEFLAPAVTAKRPTGVKSNRSISLLDLSVGGLIFLFLLPLMLLCALAVAVTSRGPIIYRQVRIGREGREFTCFKFRTMTDSAGLALDSLLAEGSPFREEWAAAYKLRADPRVTALGRFMRRYSLDELPQLFNVFKGDMSIVGPRPIVADEIHRYGDHFVDYCNVKPGITGLWQVSGRHSVSYDERVRLDAEYAKAKSVRLDLLILWRTIPVVLFGENE